MAHSGVARMTADTAADGVAGYNHTSNPLMAADSKDRLDSWKEIAAFLNRGVRTVQRWEASEGLPVHRHQHQKLGSVFALKSEVSAWWSSRSVDLGGEDSAVSSAEQTRKVRLLVLPFENLGADPTEDYLADGFTEELITQLARLRPDRLAVIARTTAMHYKGCLLYTSPSPRDS